ELPVPPCSAWAGNRFFRISGALDCGALSRWSHRCLLAAYIIRLSRTSSLLPVAVGLCANAVQSSIRVTVPSSAAFVDRRELHPGMEPKRRPAIHHPLSLEERRPLATALWWLLSVVAAKRSASVVDVTNQERPFCSCRHSDLQIYSSSPSTCAWFESAIVA
ncbi:hypothetical protein PIB30_081959, partial [Stylosanthes scabra]|nr:hypothetical protein [Stylosanthes scabra]